ncbi:DUF1351 domain-containing protein [Rheinheimera sp. MMS21-TC3]|uniref:DUF1351 domain-containing protein n=1 Tax=Rheinheimera sp. MMS21-TC3 TaxID=3072790 RepID=UPI0028C3E1DF|nr:DUF1351 domain-containing protein [Rheinheimera sp. MMS21-TC3]WNO60411.1 DUF1351 domain-containing protein [Rheinheimera sp. MMS21-TC3]
MSAAEKLTQVEQDQVESTELVVAIKKHAVIAGNFDEVRAYFVEQLQAYDVVVTAETLADAKKLCTELNKMATEVKSRGKVVIDEASEPINEAKEQVKQLAALLVDARAKLVEQVKIFEDEQKAIAHDALQAYLIEQGEAKGIQPEFQRATVDGLVTLSTLTATGNLTAKSKAAVDERISADLQLQTQTEMRLLKLENESYKAGLAVALERRHVEPFLFADDNEYSMRLASLLETEVQREARAREAADKRAAEQAKYKAEAEQRAAKAEADRAEADKQREKDRLAHEAELAEAKQQAQAQLAEQAEQFKRAPQPHVAPISMGEQAVKHAIGPVDSPTTATFHNCSFGEACLIASGIDAEKVGIWTRESGNLPHAIIIKGSLVASHV